MNFFSAKKDPAPAAPSNGVDASFTASRPYFLLGDLIQGNLTILSVSGTVIGSVQAEIICVAQGYYYHSLNGEGPSSFEQYFPSHQYLKTAPFVLFEARPIGGTAVLSTTQPVSFPILVSQELPSTVTDRTERKLKLWGPLTVKYTLKLTTFGMNGELLSDNSCPLDIRAVHVYPNPEKPLKKSYTVETRVCCFAKSLVVYCVTDRTVYGPGDRIRLSYWYDASNPVNHPTITAVKVRLSFKVKSLIRSTGEYAVTTEEQTKLVSFEAEVPSIGEVFTYNVDVPESVIPDFTPSGAPHPIEYKHELEVMVEADKVFFEVPVPVVFNTLSSAQLAQVQYPVLQKPLPQLAIAAQALYASDPNPPDQDDDDEEDDQPSSSGAGATTGGAAPGGTMSSNPVAFAPVPTTTH